MHTLRLLLLTTEYDEQVMNKRFYATSHIHNVLVKHAKKLLRKISHDSRYEDCRKTYVSLPKKENLSSADKKYKKQLSQEMKDIRISMGLSEAGLQSYIKKMRSPVLKMSVFTTGTERSHPCLERRRKSPFF